VKKCIQEGVDDISLAANESITNTCENYPAAGKLVTAMLYQMQVFVNNMYDKNN
jgi:hypothetical protein